MRTKFGVLLLLVCALLLACTKPTGSVKDDPAGDSAIATTEGVRAEANTSLNYKASGDYAKYDYVSFGSYLVRVTRLSVTEMDAFVEFYFANGSEREVSLLNDLQFEMLQDGKPVILEDEKNRPLEEISWKDKNIAPKGSEFLYVHGKVDPTKPIQLRFSVKDHAESVEYQFEPDPQYTELYLKQHRAVYQTVLLFGDYLILTDAGSVREADSSTILSVLRRDGANEALEEEWEITLQKGDTSVPLKEVQKIAGETPEMVGEWFANHRVKIGEADIADRYRFVFEAQPQESEEWNLTIIDRMQPAEMIVIPYHIEKTPFDGTGI